MHRYSKLFLVFISLLALYLILTFVIPPNPETLGRYGITAIQARLLRLAIAVPFALIWCTAFYSYVRLKEYAYLIDNSRDGKAFIRIANGLGILAVGQALQSVFSSLLNYRAHVSPEFLPTAVILRHYAAIIISLVAFWIVYSGARALKNGIKGGLSARKLLFVQFGLLLLVITYAYVVFANPARNQALSSSSPAIYYLPDWLIILSIILPYAYVWYMGLLSALSINTYRDHVNGIIYKRSFKQLAYGIGIVISGSILLQYLTAVGNLLTDWGLAQLLSIVYLLLITIATGYILIASGARKLQKIEEV